jgi:hypothetical protein
MVCHMHAGRIPQAGYDQGELEADPESMQDNMHPQDAYDSGVPRHASSNMHGEYSNDGKRLSSADPNVEFEQQDMHEGYAYDEPYMQEGAEFRVMVRGR